MRKVILLLTTSLFLFSICDVNAQSFNEKPVAFLQKQLTMKLTVAQLKKEIPEGYTLADETKENIVFEKVINGKTYDITYGLDTNGKIYMFTFKAHSNRAFKRLGELENLGYIKDESGKMGAVEFIMYKNSKLKLLASVIINDNAKEVTVILSNKGYK